MHEQILTKGFTRRSGRVGRDSLLAMIPANTITEAAEAATDMAHGQKKEATGAAAEAAAVAAAGPPAKRLRVDSRGGGGDQTTTFVVEQGLKRGPRLETVGDEALARAWAGKGVVEARSPAPQGQVATFTANNLFAEAVHRAFYEHYPLVISPDVIWLTVLQGLANHVDQNAEALRSKFVEHEGKQEIVIDRPGFVKGSAHNDWEGVFPEFEAKIGAHVGAETVDALRSSFSTTGPAARVASVVALMDTVQHYFEYTMRCGCGFPTITLKGGADDWQAVRRKAEVLRRYDLDWWLDALLPVLDQFVAAAAGTPDVDFWRSLCNFRGASGMISAPITGWLQVFFPYLNHAAAKGWGSFEEADAAFVPTKDGTPKRTMRRNGGLAEYQKSHQAGVGPSNWSRDGGGFGGGGNGCGSGVKLELIPPGLASAPFKYVDVPTGRTYDMAFMAGVSSIVQHAESGALEPVVGWAVLERQKN